MKLRCGFVLESYWTPSDHRLEWETEGEIHSLPKEFHLITVQPGQLIFSYTRGPSEDRSVLYRTPKTREEFIRFAKKAIDRSSQEAYYQLLAQKNEIDTDQQISPATKRFRGHFLEDWEVKQWCDACYGTNLPLSLEEAKTELNR